MLYILTYYCGFVESFYEKSTKIITIDYCLTQLSADFFYLLENFSVGGAEVIKVDLIGSYKSYIVMFEPLRLARRDLGIEKSQVNGDIGVDMIDLHEYIADLDRHAYLLTAFPYQSLGQSFARLGLAADKFPLERPRLIDGPLAYHKPIPAPYKRRRNLNHI